MLTQRTNSASDGDVERPVQRLVGDGTSINRSIVFVAAVALELCALFFPGCSPADGAPETAKLRSAVVGANDHKQAGSAYQEYFGHVGLGGLGSLQQDAHTGISLQAAWESNKTPIERSTSTPNHSDWLLDPVSMQQFLGFLKTRTALPVPSWWEEVLLSADYFPSKHHAFVGSIYEKRDKTPVGILAPPGTNVEIRAEQYVIKTTGRTVSVSTDVFEAARERVFGAHFLVAYIDRDKSVVAFAPIAGFPYNLLCVDSKTGARLWEADVWAAGRDFLGGKGVHRLSCVRKDDVIAIFGAESHGAYVEAFDLQTGRSRFRFCTCYWFNFSERWNLK